MAYTPTWSTPIAADLRFAEEFQSFFDSGDVAAASEFLTAHPELMEFQDAGGYSAHPFLRTFVDGNNGHCYGDRRLAIADLLTQPGVRVFRDAIAADRVEEVREQLAADKRLANADITLGRGIAKPIHHWKSTAIAQLLINAGADLKVVTTRSESPLEMQIRFGTVENVRFLLSAGVDPNFGVRCCVPTESMVEVIELLIEHGWKIGSEMLLHDANHGFGKRVVTWLKYGADANARTAKGSTALHLFAARGTGADAIRALVEAGADLTVKDEAGRTALDLARTASKRAAERVLVELNGGA